MHTRNCCQTGVEFSVRFCERDGLWVAKKWDTVEQLSLFGSDAAEREIECTERAAILHFLRQQLDVRLARHGSLRAVEERAARRALGSPPAVPLRPYESS